MADVEVRGRFRRVEGLEQGAEEEVDAEGPPACAEVAAYHAIVRRMPSSQETRGVQPVSAWSFS